MDVIEYKLATDNPILISHAICKLLRAIKEKIANGEDESKIPEFKYLLSLCSSENGIVAITACQAVVDLARKERLASPGIITNLTACLVTAKHGGAIASAICNLLSLESKTLDSKGDRYVCPFNLKSPRHPLITILELKRDSWKDILNHVATMMKHCEPGSLKNHVALLRPVFLYILCDPKLSVSESCRQTAWNLLINIDGAKDVRNEVVQWLRTKNLECCIDSNNRIIELAEFANARKCKEICQDLIPLILSMGLELLRHGRDPRSNLDALSTILHHGRSDRVNILICMLAEMITIAPSIYLVDIVSMASTVMEKTSCNCTIAHTLIASIVEWMAYPSQLTSDAMDIAKRLIRAITNGPPNKSESLKLDDENDHVRTSFTDANVKFYTKLCSCVESWRRENIFSWMDKVSKLPIHLMVNYKIIIAAIFLESKDTAVVVKSCDMLVDISKNGGQVLSLFLYKLTNSQDIEQTKALVFSLPKLTGLKENLAIVMHTLKTLSGARKPLNNVAIELYVHALAGDPRCHRYIQEALIDLCNHDNSWQADVTCARAMRYICEKHPEHGTELVPLLSRILNRCSDRSGGAASALALESISSLCVAGVTEICSTWRVLSPKMNKEQRSIVLRGLCHFFGSVPLVPSQDSQDFNNLVIQVLTKLWDYAMNSNDIDIIEAAFKGLSGHRLESMTLAVLPDKLKIFGDQVPENTPQIADCPTKTLNSITTFIPSACWIAMLENVNPSGLSVAGNFLQHLIEEELYSFRSGIYRWPHGEPLNFKYLADKSPLRAVGEHIRHYDSHDNDNEKRIAIVVECLRIFAHEYPKALPPIQWRYMDPAIGISSVTRKYGIELACHQASVSPSANEFVEKYLTNVTKDWIASARQIDECSNVYGKLNHICRAVGSNVLGPYLEITCNSIVEKANADKDNCVAMFDRIMKCFAQALKDELIQNDNRSMVATTLEKLIVRIDADSKMFQSYTNAVVELNSEQVERMTLPSVWLEVTLEKLKKAIKIRAKLVLTKKVDVPLTWMNEIIRATASSPAVHTCLLEQLEIILPQMRMEKSNAQWTLDLMRWIGVMIVDSDETANIESALFLCEILFITVICLSATECLQLNDCTLAASHVVRAELFPQALAGIVRTANWRDIVHQTMEWLNRMRTTPIPTLYKSVFHNALVSLKNESHFDVMWTKILSPAVVING